MRDIRLTIEVLMSNAFIEKPHRKPVCSAMIFVVVFVCLVSIFSAGKALAVLATSPLSYQDSIDTDEEGKKLFMPVLVYSDPVMNETYVIDSNRRVIIYTEDNFPLYTFNISPSAGLAVDENGTIYLAQPTTSAEVPRSKISVFNGCFQWVRDIFFEGFENAEAFSPSKVALDNEGHLYVISSNYYGALVMDTEGNLLEILRPEKDGKSVHLVNVAVDKHGKIYLVSETEGRIYVYGRDLKPLFEFGEKGGSSGKLSRPRSLAIDNRNGNIYIVDYMRHTVNVYDKEGELLFEFGGKGWSPGWFAYPVEISVDQNGRVLVADLFNNRVQSFLPRTLSEKPIELDIAGFTSDLFSTERHNYDNYFGDSLLRRLRTEKSRETIQFPLP